MSTAMRSGESQRDSNQHTERIKKTDKEESLEQARKMSGGRLPPRQVVPVGVHEQQERIDVFSNIRSNSLESMVVSPVLIYYFSFWGGVLGVTCNAVGLIYHIFLLIEGTDIINKLGSGCLMCLCSLTFLFDIPNIIHYTQMPKRWRWAVISFRIIAVSHICIGVSAFVLALVTRNGNHAVSCMNLVPSFMYYLALKRGENQAEPATQELLV